MTNISLSIIIVNYNTFKLTRDTINSCISEPTLQHLQAYKRYNKLLHLRAYPLYL